MCGFRVPVHVVPELLHVKMYKMSISFFNIPACFGVHL